MIGSPGDVACEMAVLALGNSVVRPSVTTTYQERGECRLENKT